MQGLSFLEKLSICLRHPILLQQVLSPGGNITSIRNVLCRLGSSNNCQLYAPLRK